VAGVSDGIVGLIVVAALSVGLLALAVASVINTRWLTRLSARVTVLELDRAIEKRGHR
jgi:hypothetical protein